MHIAIFGGGQLARMMALAGWPLGYRFTFLTEPGEGVDGVAGLGNIVVRESDWSSNTLYHALGQPDVVTVEREQVDVELLRSLTTLCAVYPNPEAISICQHRSREKTFLQSLDIPVAPFRLVSPSDDLAAAVAALDGAVFIKSCEMGYDGQNQWRISDVSELGEQLPPHERPELVVEQKITFDRELSLIAARSRSGDTLFYPLTENRHKASILLSSLAPAPALAQRTQQQAEEIATRLLQAWDYVGVLAIEFFDVGGELLVNELAPRVHNSGHWTQNAGICSQFENHLRTIAGQAPGQGTPARPSAMLNLLGLPAPQDIAFEPDAHLHWYNKAVRPRRKVGHINFQADDADVLAARLHDLERALYGQGDALE
jgi:5-(carboxyamino)imidazole ribonucleotide synthase